MGVYYLSSFPRDRTICKSSFVDFVYYCFLLLQYIPDSFISHFLQSGDSQYFSEPAHFCRQDLAFFSFPCVLLVCAVWSRHSAAEWGGCMHAAPRPGSVFGNADSWCWILRCGTIIAPVSRKFRYFTILKDKGLNELGTQHAWRTAATCVFFQWLRSVGEATR